MSYIISSEKLILNYFASNKRKKTISVKNLGELACNISNACNHGVIVTVNKTAIEYAVIKQHSSIAFANGKVRLICPHDNIKQQIKYINSDMPLEIRQICKIQCVNYG